MRAGRNDGPPATAISAAPDSPPMRRGLALFDRFSMFLVL
jgi:hypothetical protein